MQPTQSAMRHGMARRKREFVDAAGGKTMSWSVSSVSGWTPTRCREGYSKKKESVIPVRDGDEEGCILR
jgi:hypothetical protein